jgi:hypothetical protein
VKHITLTLADAGGRTPPPEVRLRRLLKLLLRTFGFRCVEVREHDPAATTAADGGTDGQTLRYSQ